MIRLGSNVGSDLSHFDLVALLDYFVLNAALGFGVAHYLRCLVLGAVLGFDAAHCLYCFVLGVALGFDAVHCLYCLVLDVALDFDAAHCLHCLVLDVALGFGVVHCLRCLVLDVGVLGLNGLRSLSCSVYCFVSILYFLFYSGNLGCSSSSFHGILVFRAG